MCLAISCRYLYFKGDVNLYTGKSYVKDKLKMLKEFGIKIDGNLESELKSMKSTSDIDRKCRTIIRDHLDRINETDSHINRRR